MTMTRSCPESSQWWNCMITLHLNCKLKLAKRTSTSWDSKLRKLVRWKDSLQETLVGPQCQRLRSKTGQARPCPRAKASRQDSAAHNLRRAKGRVKRHKLLTTICLPLSLSCSLSIKSAWSSLLVTLVDYAKVTRTFPLDSKIVDRQRASIHWLRRRSRNTRKVGSLAAWLVEWRLTVAS